MNVRKILVAAFLLILCFPGIVHAEPIQTITIMPTVAMAPTPINFGIDPPGVLYQFSGNIEMYSLSFNQYYTTDTDKPEIQYEPLDLKPVVIPNVPVEDL